MEGWPAIFIPLPALAQQVVDLARAQRRPVEMDGRRRRRQVGVVAAAAAAVPSITVVNDFVVGHRRERHLATKRQDLPHRDAERPHIALRRESSLRVKRQMRDIREGGNWQTNRRMKQCKHAPFLIQSPRRTCYEELQLCNISTVCFNNFR